MDGGKVISELKKQTGLWLALAGLLGVYLFYSYLDKSGGYFNDTSDLFMINPDDTVITDDSDNTTTGKYSSKPSFIIDLTKNYSAVITTSYGNITVDLYEDSAPNTVNNFVFLANEKFYNGLTFHRIVKDFVIQGGDPLGNGQGGPGYTFDDEVSKGDKFLPYTLAMANSGVNADGSGTNGSQFFITTKNSDTTYLAGKHTIFGKVTSGFSVVDEIEKAQVDGSYRPVQNVYIQKVEITAR